jgi:hypothetical protein
MKITGVYNWLKSLLLAKNRLNLGKFDGDKCILDTEISKVNILFDEVKFDIEKRLEDSSWF